MREFPFISMKQSTDGCFQICVDILVHNPNRLWSAAVSRCRSSTNLEIEEIEDVLGPSEDPDLPACISMLMKPVSAPGCVAIDVTVIPHSGEGCKIVEVAAPAVASIR